MNTVRWVSHRQGLTELDRRLRAEVTRQPVTLSETEPDAVASQSPVGGLASLVEHAAKEAAR